ncbi:MAG: type II toxin-antitoxin system prevent-host-death family antitoxin [Candidatus Rokubacteria bacterium]|nr:type II toxin-antitoxin system prevent-host-death family antitoxin [Candidatus Rokubacteria bacterium]
MKRVKIAELKNNLSRYLAQVQAGNTVIVLDRDRPVAKIVPLEPADLPADDDERLAELERQGLIRRGNPAGVREWLKKHRPVKLTGGGSLVDDLLEERRSGW